MFVGDVRSGRLGMAVPVYGSSLWKGPVYGCVPWLVPVSSPRWRPDRCGPFGAPRGPRLSELPLLGRPSLVPGRRWPRRAKGLSSCAANSGGHHDDHRHAGRFPDSNVPEGKRSTSAMAWFGSGHASRKRIEIRPQDSHRGLSAGRSAPMTSPGYADVRRSFKRWVRSLGLPRKLTERLMRPDEDFPILSPDDPHRMS